MSTFESAYNKKTGKTVILSEQQLLDCSVGTSGCGGGFYDKAWNHIISNKNVDTSSAYPVYIFLLKYFISFFFKLFNH